MAGIRPGVRWLLRIALRRENLTGVDVDREIAFHLDARTAQLEAQGMSPDGARAEALRRFGDLEEARALLTNNALQQESRLATRERMEALVEDVRYALRTLGRSRRFAEPLLFATSPRDKLVFLLATITLTSAALLACYVPALRASRVDPASALRSD